MSWNGGGGRCVKGWMVGEVTEKDEALWREAGGSKENKQLNQWQKWVSSGTDDEVVGADGVKKI